jgi:hypothetical protein
LCWSARFLAAAEEYAAILVLGTELVVFGLAR